MKTMINLLKHSQHKGTYTNAQGKVINIYITQAYDDFILLEANREVVERTVKKIMASMLVKVEHAPILVNERAEVIDGQNRLEAYRRLDLPITFEMIEGLSVDTVRRLNAIQKEWKISDHLHAGATQEDVNYKWMYNFCKLHNLQPSTAIVLLKGHANNNSIIVAEIRSGEFTCTKDERAIAAERMAILEKFRGYSKATTKNFVTALVKVLEVKDLDKNRLITSFLQRYKSTLPGISGSYESYMFQLQEMYNYKLLEKNKLRFLSAAELERLNRKG